MKNEQGFNLLECLMVLVVVAVICLLSIHRYRDYRRSIQMANIKSDIAALQEALNRYYHKEGCRTDGTFARDLTPSLDALGVSLPGRPPQIPLAGNAYQASIVDTELKTTDKTDGKPVYELQVSATFSSSYSSQRMLWYQHALGADTLSGRRLTWTSLPSNTAVAHGTQLWVMKPQGEQFRQYEDKQWRDLQSDKDKRVSAAYCVH